MIRLPILTSTGLSNPLQKPYIRRVSQSILKRPMALTIAAGFECAEGFVLCADRQMSHGTANTVGSFAHYETKVFGSAELYFAIAICGSGNDGSLTRPFAEAFFKTAVKDNNNPETDLSKIPIALEDCLNDLTTRIGAIDDKAAATKATATPTPMAKAPPKPAATDKPLLGAPHISSLWEF